MTKKLTKGDEKMTKKLTKGDEKMTKKLTKGDEKMTETVINEWPESQICVGCKSATPLIGGCSRYICELNLMANSMECEQLREEATDEEWQEKFT